MESSSCRSLELRVMHCKDLKAFNFFQKLSVYALVSLVSDDDDPSMRKKLEQQQQRTPPDTEGDKNPEWNHEMRFDLGGHGTGDECEYDDHLFLHFDLRSELTIFGHKSLGEVRVLIKDLINEEEEESAGDGIIRFVNYEVRTADGKPNGVLSFSYKLLNEYKGNGGKTFTKKKKKKKNVHIDGYPVVNHINNDDDDHFHNRVDYPSLLPDDYLQIPLGSGTDQSQESYHLAAADASHRLHYPSMEIPPYPAAAGAGEGYRINYPQPYDQFHHHPPPPPPPPFLHPHPPPPPPPFLHHPPPPPPHMGPGAGFYHSRSPWAHEHPYPN